jgi:quercetin dioxygenase-like cupin family protein
VAPAATPGPKEQPTWEKDMHALRKPGELALAGLLVVALASANAGIADGLDPPLARTITDSSLAWGPCPPVFPAGCEIAVLHGDPAKPNADVFFKVPANAVIPHHWHTSAERMALVSGELHVTYDGHDTTVLTVGTYAYGPPGAPHRAVCQDKGPCVLFIAFEGPVDVQTGDAK